MSKIEAMDDEEVDSKEGILKGKWRKRSPCQEAQCH